MISEMSYNFFFLIYEILFKFNVIMSNVSNKSRLTFLDYILYKKLSIIAILQILYNN